MEVKSKGINIGIEEISLLMGISDFSFPLFINDLETQAGTPAPHFEPRSLPRSRTEVDGFGEARHCGAILG